MADLKTKRRAEAGIGDIIRHKVTGIRYRITSLSGGVGVETPFVAAHRIRKDGQRDRREFGWSGDLTDAFEVESD